VKVSVPIHRTMKIVALTGAGISAESGIPTFRGAGGLWEGHRLEDVATPEAWARDPELVLRFYNMRRTAVCEAQPNAAHIALAKLEARHEVTIITQNIDDLHERAQSSRIIHLHGEIMKVRSTCGAGKVLPWGARDIVVGDLCPEGSQLRPHVVWFGEEVTAYTQAVPMVQQAELILIIGTSLQVYPAAGLVEFASPGIPIYVVNPDDALGYLAGGADVTHFAEPAAQAVPRIVAELMGE
jgi:NAD-dependent deacetylase